MQRARLLAAFAGVAAVTSASLWLFTAEARGGLPAGRYDAMPRSAWALTDAGGRAIRDDALRRAVVRLDPAAAGRLPRAGALSSRDGSFVICRFVTRAPSGTSPKFDCVLDGGEVVTVKYGRNPEIHAEAAATRLLRTLGYAADETVIVPRLRCYGCPRFPFMTMKVLSLAWPGGLPRYGYDNTYTDFEWVSVQRRFPAPAIETAEVDGWAWWELDTLQEAPRADVDAFRLLAVFLAHWDNKADNQRLVCLDPPPSQPDQRCAHPLAMIDDAGATFGPTKANLARWRATPVWTDRGRCLVSMRALPFDGATFPDVRIGEAGRAQLARRLGDMTRRDVEALFSDARFPEFQSGTDDARDLDAWVAAWRHRVDQIVTAGPCKHGSHNSPLPAPKE